ncbi:DUF3617 domain-containing protein [Alteriqipengyuania sp. 357]
MRTIIAASACLALLSACSDGGADSNGDGEITGEETAAEAASGGEMKMRAGQWENTIEFTELDMPGVPASVKEMIAGQMGQSITTTSCITQEEADQPDAGFFGGDKKDNCTYDEFDRSGDSLTLRMTCAGDNGGTAKIAMDGAFDEDNFTLTMDSTITGTETGEVTMKGKVTGTRIGDCPG